MDLFCLETFQQEFHKFSHFLRQKYIFQKPKGPVENLVSDNFPFFTEKYHYRKIFFPKFSKNNIFQKNTKQKP